LLVVMVVAVVALMCEVVQCTAAAGVDLLLCNQAACEPPDQAGAIHSLLLLLWAIQGCGYS
jgi:hypothetical protein